MVPLCRAYSPVEEIDNKQVKSQVKQLQMLISLIQEIGC